MNRVDPLVLQAVFGRHLALYRSRIPYYQATMLSALGEVWKGRHRRLLDIGGGTGVIAQAVSELFPVDSVESIDLIDRFCPSISIPVRRYDGGTLPFDDGQFDAAMLNNVVHHVPVNGRFDLLREIRRVVHGPLYIKDHESHGVVDSIRLAALDAIGNIPFGGMLWARYLKPIDWETLAAKAGYRITARAIGSYRSGAAALFFPNRLEITMRFESCLPV